MIACWVPLVFHSLAKTNWSLMKTVDTFLLSIMETITPLMSSMKQVCLALKHSGVFGRTIIPANASKALLNSNDR